MAAKWVKYGTGRGAFWIALERGHRLEIGRDGPEFVLTVTDTETMRMMTTARYAKLSTAKMGAESWLQDR